MESGTAHVTVGRRVVGSAVTATLLTADGAVATGVVDPPPGSVVDPGYVADPGYVFVVSADGISSVTVYAGPVPASFFAATEKV